MIQKKRKKLAVVIGRFQGLHFGHQSIILTALQEAEKVLVIIGDHGYSRNLKNPFTVEERREVIEASFEAFGSQLMITSNKDNPSDEVWSSKIKELVDCYCKLLDCPSNAENVILIGKDKDASTAYLRWFPDWSYGEPEPGIVGGQHGGDALQKINATQVREVFFGEKFEALKGLVGLHSYSWLNKFRSTEAFKHLQADYVSANKYKDLWSGSPFPPVFATADAVVVWNDYILLVERATSPGRGQLAIPGGFLDPGEKFKSCAIRELIEETGIKMVTSDIEKCWVKSILVDTPDRSSRGRIITEAHYFNVSYVTDNRGWDRARPELIPDADPDGGAANAKWHRIRDLDPRRMFEDHGSILKRVLGTIPPESFENRMIQLPW